MLNLDNKHEHHFKLQDIITKSLCRALVHVNYYDADKNALIVNATSPEGFKSKYVIFKIIFYIKNNFEVIIRINNSYNLF